MDSRALVSSVQFFGGWLGLASRLVHRQLRKRRRLLRSAAVHEENHDGFEGNHSILLLPSCDRLIRAVGAREAGAGRDLAEIGARNLEEEQVLLQGSKYIWGPS